MPVRALYRGSADLPSSIALFPLGGALLLPRGQLPLNIFEPRYLAMINAAISSERIIGMVQPATDEALALQDNADARPELYDIGCAGRIASFSETEDGRMVITLTGISRFRIETELDTTTPFRIAAVDFGVFESDLEPGRGEDEVDRDRLLTIFRRYLEAHDMEADWDAVHKSSNESLVNTLSMISPYAPKEKQALLEADGLAKRADILIALTEMALSDPSDDRGTILQ